MKKNTKKVLIFSLLLITTVCAYLTFNIFNGLTLIDVNLGLKAKSIDASISQFYERYNYLPGDFPNAQKELLDCFEGQCRNGNGNSKIDEDEASLFWQHLKAANLLDEPRGGISPSVGTFVPVFYYKEKLPFTEFIGNGHYLAFISNSKIDESSGFLEGKLASRIDRKNDDGLAFSGRVIGAGNEFCFTKNMHNERLYKDDSEDKCVFLYIKIVAKQYESALKESW